MEETVKIFGQAQKEIGSLDTNLVLRTKGQVYIRYGKKYIELLDTNGNLKVKVPKIIVKIDSEDQAKQDGLYLLDNNLYAKIGDEFILIVNNSENGNYIQYIGEQELSQEQLTTAQNNIGLTFNTIEEALKEVKTGIVHVGNKIYYINNNSATSVIENLNNPLKEINNTELEEHPREDNAAIVYESNSWKYIRVVTYDEFIKYITKEEDPKPEQETNKYYNIDLYEYSTGYNLEKLKIVFEKDISDTSRREVMGNKINHFDFSISPKSNIIKNSEGIISIVGGVVDGEPEPDSTGNYTFNKKTATAWDSSKKTTYTYLVKEPLVIDVLIEDVLKPIVHEENGKIKYSPIEVILNVENTQEDIQENSIYYDLMKYNGKWYCFNNSLQYQLNLYNKKIYIKAEFSASQTSKKQTFLINHPEASFELQENNTSPNGNNKYYSNQTNLKLGNIYDYDYLPNTNNYNYSSQGLYSDKNILSNVLFQPSRNINRNMNELMTEESNGNPKVNINIWEFPRYLDQFRSWLMKFKPNPNDNFQNIVPPLGWITNWVKNYFLKEPLKSIQDDDGIRTLPTKPNYAIVTKNKTTSSNPTQKWKYLEVASKNELTALADRVYTLETNPSGGGETSELTQDQVFGNSLALRMAYLESGQGVISFIQNQKNTLVPIGYALCDGKNGTPILTSSTNDLLYVQKIRPSFISIEFTSKTKNQLSSSFNTAQFSFVEIGGLLYNPDILSNNEKNHLEDPYKIIYLYYSEYYHINWNKFSNNNININDAIFLGGFKNNENIKSVSANYRFNVIKDEAFSGCSNLDTVYLPDSIEYIGSNAFADCSSNLTIQINSLFTCETNSFETSKNKTIKLQPPSKNISEYYNHISKQGISCSISGNYIIINQ